MKLCIRICNSEENSEVSGREMRDRLRELNFDPEAFTLSSCLVTCNLGAADRDVEGLLDAFKTIA